MIQSLPTSSDISSNSPPHSLYYHHTEFPFILQIQPLFCFKVFAFADPSDWNNLFPSLHRLISTQYLDLSLRDFSLVWASLTTPSQSKLGFFIIYLELFLLNLFCYLYILFICRIFPLQFNFCLPKQLLSSIMSGTVFVLSTTEYISSPYNSACHIECQ